MFNYPGTLKLLTQCVLVGGLGRCLPTMVCNTPPGILASILLAISYLPWLSSLVPSRSQSGTNHGTKDADM